MWGGQERYVLFLQTAFLSLKRKFERGTSEELSIELTGQVTESLWNEAPVQGKGVGEAELGQEKSDI